MACLLQCYNSKFKTLPGLTSKQPTVGSELRNQSRSSKKSQYRIRLEEKHKISTEASYLPNIVNSAQEALIVTSYQGLAIGISTP